MIILINKIFILIYFIIKHKSVIWKYNSYSITSIYYYIFSFLFNHLNTCVPWIKYLFFIKDTMNIF